MEVSVRELKSRLSEYLHRVAQGEEVVVTSHGREVARLVAPRVRRRKPVVDEAELVARIRRMPGVRPGLDKRPPLPPPLLHIRPGEKTLAEMVIEDRE